MVEITKLFSKIIVGGGMLTLALSLNVLYAWTAPSDDAPGGNFSSPVHAGTASQVKPAALSVNALGVFGNSYIQGDLGVGVVSPQYQLDLNGGATGIRFPDGSVQTSASGAGMSSVVALSYLAPANTGYVAAPAGWNTMPLNTEVDPAGIATLSSNQFTLSAGTYEVIGYMAHGGRMSVSDAPRVRLQNITTGATVLWGQSAYETDESSGGTGTTNIIGIVTITAGNSYALQVYGGGWYYVFPSTDPTTQVALILKKIL